MPEQRIRILSTKLLDPGLVEEAAKAGIAIDTRPFILTTLIDDVTLTERLRELLGKNLTAVFTSVNGVEGVGRAASTGLPVTSGTAQTDGKIPWKIFCIGGTTGRVVREYFGEGCIGGEAGSAAKLAEVIIECATGEVYFFCGDLRREDLPGKLKEASIRVEEVVVYRTTPTPQKIEDGYEGILFFSPSGVDSFFSLNGPRKDIALFAIGETTAESIRKYAGNPVIVAPSPDTTAMVRQVTDHFRI
jgi:uroporphyrinogen-III synthase